MLSVGIQLHGAVVTVLRRVAQPGLERARQPQVDRQVNEVEPVLPADSGRLVPAAVVDHHIIILGKPLHQVLDNPDDIGFLVVSGNDNE